MQKKLQEYGLSEKEAAVYSAALELGPATADQLAKHSEVKRSTTYLQIESLQEKGLMSSYEEGKKTLYTPESPENLARLIDRQKATLDQRQRELEKELPDLVRMFEGAGERPVVRFYQGKEGIVTVREEMLGCVSKITRVFFAADQMEKLFTDEERAAYTRQRESLGIELHLLYTRSEGPFTDTDATNSKRKFLETGDHFPIKNDISVYDDKVAFFSMSGNPFAVVIQSSSVAITMASLFDIIWDNK